MHYKWKKNGVNRPVGKVEWLEPGFTTDRWLKWGWIAPAGQRPTRSVDEPTVDRAVRKKETVRRKKTGMTSGDLG